MRFKCSVHTELVCCESWNPVLNIPCIVITKHKLNLCIFEPDFVFIFEPDVVIVAK